MAPLQANDSIFLYTHGRKEHITWKNKKATKKNTSRRRDSILQPSWAQSKILYLTGNGSLSEAKSKAHIFTVQRTVTPGPETHFIYLDDKICTIVSGRICDPFNNKDDTCYLYRPADLLPEMRSNQSENSLQGGGKNFIKKQAKIIKTVKKHKNGKKAQKR